MRAQPVGLSVSIFSTSIRSSRGDVVLQELANYRRVRRGAIDDNHRPFADRQRIHQISQKKAPTCQSPGAHQRRAGQSLKPTGGVLDATIA